MVEVTTVIVINRPRKVVAEYVIQPDNATKWYKNIKSIKWKTKKPLRVGSVIGFTATFLGHELKYDYKVIELVDEEKIVMHTENGSFDMETTYILNALDSNKTQMILRNKGSQSGFSKLFAPFISFAMKKENEKDLKRIKSILESSAT